MLEKDCLPALVSPSPFGIGTSTALTVEVSRLCLFGVCPKSPRRPSLKYASSTSFLSWQSLIMWRIFRGSVILYKVATSFKSQELRVKPYIPLQFMPPDLSSPKVRIGRESICDCNCTKCERI